ncbi:urokinase plasminogen activator surface receptor-like isoform X2 [Salarias fasciatus]|uniref:urokinase plasminogen activator surface receptor-like isoform X2 n=1 Tax=Salarias fasciatus TaxID=181472 RepID=UPI0011769082|nr:urokinase plasminogen activator surface receptor-like isoform X2 [Salarias fasciatus]
MKFLTLLALLAFSATAAAFYQRSCKRCNDPNDLDCELEDQVVCPWGKMCLTASAILEIDGTQKTRIFKDCVGADLCPSTGQRQISGGVGDAYALANVYCCQGNGCNDEELPFPEFSSHEPNRRICSSCEGEDCLEVECRGDEDTCFTGQLLVHGEYVPLVGCGTEDVCSAAAALESVPFLEKLGTVAEEPECSEAPEPQARRCLMCNDTTDSTCASTTEIECPMTDDQCVTATFLGGRVYRGCGPPSVCPADRPVDTVVELAIESGGTAGGANLKCCRGDNCNNDTLAAPAAGTNNGMFCSICFPGTSICNFLIQCQGIEDRCFSAIGNVSGSVNTLLGCASASVCEAPGSAAAPFLLSDTELMEPLSCCEGLTCNDPDRPTEAPPTTTMSPPTSSTSSSSEEDDDSDFGDGFFPTSDPLEDPFLGGGAKDAVAQQMLFLVQQLLLYLQQLQLFLLLVYVQLMLQQAALW